MTRYVYIHARPDTEDAAGIFYVGKGRGYRANVLPKRNRHHGFVVDKHGAENILTGKMDCSNDEIAFELERGLIKCLRRAGVQLTNMTDGGDGTTGHVVTEEGRKRRSESMTARWADPEQRAYLSKVNADRLKTQWATPESRERLAKALKGNKKTMTEAALAARRASLVKARSPDGIAKHAAVSKDQWSDPERKARQAEGLRNAWKDPVKRASMMANRPSQKGLVRKGVKNNSRDENVISTITSRKED